MVLSSYTTPTYIQILGLSQLTYYINGMKNLETAVIESQNRIIDQYKDIIKAKDNMIELKQENIDFLIKHIKELYEIIDQYKNIIC
jgi:hypothetical protein